MSNMVTTKAMAKVAAVATGLAMGVSMLTFASNAYAAALSASQIQSILSLLSSFGADASTIANVQASLTGGTPVSTPSTGGSCSFTRDLTVGSSGADVTALQNTLIAGGYLKVAATGYFGSLTKSAVSAWQTAAGVSPAAGYFGAKSRAAFHCSGSTGSTGGTTVPVGSGTGLKVMLSPTSPNGTALVQGQGIGDLADFTFANPTSSAINVTTLTFKRIGVSNDSTLNNVYLYNGATRITDSAGVSSGAFSFTNPSGIFTVQPGMSVTISVRSDILTGTAGQQIGVSLVSAASSGTLDGSVSFPIMGGYQSISAANLATVSFNSNPTPSAATSISPQANYPVWQNTVNVSVNPVKLSAMKFTNLGSAGASSISNLRLYVDGTVVGSAVAGLDANRSVTFDLSANPVLLSTQGHIIKVLADITGGSSFTYQFSVQRSSDAMFIDNQLGQPVTPLVANANFTANTTGVITINSVSTSGVSTSLDPASPNQNVAAGGTNIKFASFDMLASGENVKVSDLFVYASSTQSSGALAGVGGLQNGKVYVNGVQIGSTKNIGSLVANVTDFSLGSSLILPAGVVTHVDIYGDAKDTAGTNLPNNSTVIVSLNVGSSNAQGQSSLASTNVPAAVTNGNTITVASSALTATQFSGYGAQTIVAGTNNAKLGSFTLSAGSTEGITVNTIAINFANTLNAASITNLWIRTANGLGCADTSTQVGSTITTPSSNNSFSLTKDIPVSSTQTYDICGNILSGANAGTIVANVGTGTSGTGDVTGSSVSVSALVSLQTITVGSGSLTVSRGAGDPVSANVLAGAASVKVGQFNFAAANTWYTVQNLSILVPNGVASSVSNITISYKDSNGTTQTQTQALAVNPALAYATATFTGLTFYVPTNDSANLDVYAATPTIASGGSSGAAINVSLDGGGASGGNTNSFRAVNAAGTATSTTNTSSRLASNGTLYVRKSIPTFAMLASGNSSTAPSNPLYRFSISADPAGAVEWSRLTFTVATTSVTLTNAYLVDESTGLNILDSNAGSATTTTTGIVVDLTKNNTQPKYQQIAAGTTKIYDLDATLAGFTTGSTITLSLAADGVATTSASAAAQSGTNNNVVWSDRSASPHTAPSTGVTGSADFTNGYLLQNFTTNTTSYSK